MWCGVEFTRCGVDVMWWGIDFSRMNGDVQRIDAR